jgi:hypothetical protein
MSASKCSQEGGWQWITKLRSSQSKEKNSPLEGTKLTSEEKRARWTAYSVGVPLLAGLMTIVFGFWSAKQQADLQLRLEIAKAVMGAPTRAEVLDRAELFRQLFPSEFSDVALSEKARSDAWVTGRQKELFQAISSQGMTAQKKLDLWIALYPDNDDWAKRPGIRAATVPSPQSN